MATCDHIRSAVTGDGVILMDISTGSVFHSNPVGSYIWSKLQEGETLEQIVDRLAERYVASREVIAADAREYVAALTSKGLIRGR
jgi:Coenzyme PQQ synthesis protein D (PqqD)